MTHPASATGVVAGLGSLAHERVDRIVVSGIGTGMEIAGAEAVEGGLGEDLANQLHTLAHAAHVVVGLQVVRFDQRVIAGSSERRRTCPRLSWRSWQMCSW